MKIPDKRRIVDAHLHLYDHNENRHEVLEQADETFQALIGDYSTLPRQYLLDDYKGDQNDFEIAGIVWHEFLANDPVREVLWAQQLARELDVPMAIVGPVDFLKHVAVVFREHPALKGAVVRRAAAKRPVKRPSCALRARTSRGGICNRY